MATQRALLLLAVTLIVPLAQGCASSSQARSGGGPSPTPVTHSTDQPKKKCVPPVGGRCAGPAAVTGPLTLDRHGQRLHAIFLCGGRLVARQSPQQVTISYIASRVRQGAMTCARVDLAVHLSQPLGTRPVVDAFTGKPIPVKRAP